MSGRKYKRDGECHLTHISMECFSWVTYRRLNVQRWRITLPNRSSNALVYVSNIQSGHNQSGKTVIPKKKLMSFCMMVISSTIPKNSHLYPKLVSYCYFSFPIPQHTSLPSNQCVPSLSRVELELWAVDGFEYNPFANLLSWNSLFYFQKSELSFQLNALGESWQNIFTIPKALGTDSMSGYASNVADQKSIYETIRLSPDDIQRIYTKTIPLIHNLKAEFIKHPPGSPMLRTYWTEMLLLSFFRPADQQYLCSLHTDSTHDKFLHSLAQFHMYYSKQRLGTIWFGRIPTVYSSISDELSRQSTPKGAEGLNDFYAHYNKLLLGKSGAPLSARHLGVECNPKHAPWHFTSEWVWINVRLNLWCWFLRLPFILVGDAGILGERLDRFALANILIQSFKHSQDERVMKFADHLTALPAGWWLQEPDHPSLSAAFDLLGQLTNYILSFYEDCKSGLVLTVAVLALPRSKGCDMVISAEIESILTANQATHHLIKYGGQGWASSLPQTSKKANIPHAWFHELAISRPLTGTNTVRWTHLVSISISASVLCHARHTFLQIEWWPIPFVMFYVLSLWIITQELSGKSDSTKQLDSWDKGNLCGVTSGIRKKSLSINNSHHDVFYQVPNMLSHSLLRTLLGHPDSLIVLSIRRRNPYIASQSDHNASPCLGKRRRAQAKTQCPPGMTSLYISPRHSPGSFWLYIPAGNLKRSLEYIPYQQAQLLCLSRVSCSTRAHKWPWSGKAKCCALVEELITNRQIVVDRPDRTWSKYCSC